MGKSYMDYLPKSFIVELADGPHDSISPVSGQEANSKVNPFTMNSLKVGDPVKVTTLRFDGTTGKIIRIEKDVALVQFDFNAGKHKFNVADLELVDKEKEEKSSDDRELENLRRLAGYQ